MSCLSVADTGCGMTDEVKARVFEPFFTTKAEGRGTGLGLATVYGIVDHAGGAITVTSAVGKGTTFCVYMPATDSAETVAGHEPTVTTVRGTETILLVEDEPAVAALLSIGLKKAGYKVLKAADAKQALEVARSHATSIDLLLTDVVMPGMSGRELSDRIVQHRQNLRALFMSGYSDDAVLQRGVQASSVAFIQKPFSVNVLTAKIREVRAADSPDGGLGRPSGRRSSASAREPRLDGRKRGEHHVADDLHAAGADRVEGVARGVPRRVVQIDDIHRRHAGADERQMVVFDLRALLEEVGAELQRARRVPDGVGQPGGGVVVAAQAQIAVGNHVHEQVGLDAM